MTQIMVLISNPNDYVNWSERKKYDRSKKLLKWHDYITKLHEKGKVTHIWGSHQLLSRNEFTNSQGVLIAVYDVSSWMEFDNLFIEDPLREVSRYTTIPLTTLVEDRNSDKERLARQKLEFHRDKDESQIQSFNNYRALFFSAPDYVGKHEYQEPKNPKTELNRKENTGDPLEILIIGVNPEEYITTWNDARKLIHHEKVDWWHDYIAMMINEGKVTHAWGTNDFCVIDGVSKSYAAAVTIYKVESYTEFDDLYKMDPIRDATQFWSILLQPIADQRILDDRRFQIHKKMVLKD